MTARLQQLLRERANGNQSELARMAGLTSPDINRYMSGQHLPRVEHLAAIARSCGVSVDWILGLPNSVNGASGTGPDGKLEIPQNAVALVDFEAVRRFLAGEPVGNRSAAAIPHRCSHASCRRR